MLSVRNVLGDLEFQVNFQKNMRKLKIVTDIRAYNTSQDEFSNQSVMFENRSKEHAFPN